MAFERCDPVPNVLSGLAVVDVAATHKHPLWHTAVREVDIFPPHTSASVRT